MTKIFAKMAVVATLSLSIPAFATGTSANTASLLAPSAAAQPGDAAGGNGNPCMVRPGTKGKWKKDVAGAWIRCGRAGTGLLIGGGLAAAGGAAAAAGGSSKPNSP